MGLKDDAYLQSVSGDIKVTLPDGTVKEEKRLETTPDQEHLKLEQSSYNTELGLIYISEILCVISYAFCSLSFARGNYNRFKKYVSWQESIAVLEQERKGHRELGREQQLFLFDPDTLEFTFFLPRGVWILHKLMTFIRGEYRKRGYEQVGTSRLLDTHLCEILGRAPIIGPGHCQIFHMEVHSYRALPLRFAEDREGDVSIFRRDSQIKDEVKHVLEFISHVYDKLGFTCELMLSKRPEKYFGDMETWDKAEKAFEDALNEFGHTWQMKYRQSVIDVFGLGSR
ncbi:uncharacterized protein [Rutidosis leptorrhynchoides]|uniref:uncharacterized protein n=1 Tax=Rutidosis leptorrhynchoides TaxID=125765 RepID=UPI003A992A1A